jgi:hypothetical protein
LDYFTEVEREAPCKDNDLKKEGGRRKKGEEKREFR